MANFVLAPAAVRALTNIVRGKMSQSTSAPAPAAVSRDTFPAPFAVRWAQSENEGDGAWVIWLPDTARLVMFAGAYVTPTGVTAAASLPAGYYTIDNLPAAATQIWLRIRPPASETAAATASFAGAADSGQDAINIQIAALATVAATGAKSVRQLVDSAVTVGGGSGGGGEYTPTPAPFDFDADTGAIVNCVFYFDGTLQTLPNYTNIPTTGTVYLTAVCTWDRANAHVESQLDWSVVFAIANAPAVASTDQRVLNVKLYDFSNGAPAVDYRTAYAPLQSDVLPVNAGFYPPRVLDRNFGSGNWIADAPLVVRGVEWIGNDGADPATRNRLHIERGVFGYDWHFFDGQVWLNLFFAHSRNGADDIYIECTPLSAALQSLATS